MCLIDLLNLCQFTQLYCCTYKVTCVDKSRLRHTYKSSDRVGGNKSRPLETYHPVEIALVCKDEC